MRHEDQRRLLIEFGGGRNWKACKFIVVKQDCVLGDHWHDQKDECFLIVGDGLCYVGDKIITTSGATVIEVPKGTWHKFELKDGALIIGLASEEFDPKDDHKA